MPGEIALSSCPQELTMETVRVRISPYDVTRCYTKFEMDDSINIFICERGMKMQRRT